MQTKTKKLTRTITVFMLAMINVAAVGNIRNWPLTAEYGFSSLFFFMLAALIFFIPVALVSAELATGWPQKGGVFVWVKEAFGHKMGFLAIWLLWLENVFYYPLVLSFIAATTAYIFNPAWAHNPLYTIGIILFFFWAATVANLFGMKISGWISTIGAVVGTFIPGIFIIVLGLMWYFKGNPLQINLSWESLIPEMNSFTQLAIFSGILLSLAGIEMSAVHAAEVKDPQKNYPRAILLSAFLILGLSIIGVLAIAIVIPKSEISLIAGSLQAFAYFLNAYGLNWLLPAMAILIAIGSLGGLSTWIIGPSKGLLAAAQSGDLPPYFRKITKSGMPKTLLITQASIVSLLSLLFVFMPTLSSAYWILTVLAAQLYLVMYIMLFAAGIKLRYKRPNVERAYKLPGKYVGMWIAAGIGILGGVFMLVVGFFPPNETISNNVWGYFCTLFLGMVICCVAPFIIEYFKKPSWNKLLDHEK
ncbi:MAG: amino acid permease [Chlamydiae bacterium]|nr:amino acid permease [Chlamydiota bacterium]